MIKMSVRLVKTGKCQITGAIGRTEFHHVLGRGLMEKSWKAKKINDAIKKIIGCKLVDYAPFIIELSHTVHAQHTKNEYKEAIINYIFERHGTEELEKLMDVATILGTYPREKLEAFAILQKNGINKPTLKEIASKADGRDIPVGEVAKAIRHMATKISLNKIADDLKIPVGTIKYWRRDVANPRPQNRKKVMKYYEEWRTK